MSVRAPAAALSYQPDLLCNRASPGSSMPWTSPEQATTLKQGRLETSLTYPLSGSDWPCCGQCTQNTSQRYSKATRTPEIVGARFSDGNGPADARHAGHPAEYEQEFIVERVDVGLSPVGRSGTRFVCSLSDVLVIADQLGIAVDTRAKGRTAERTAGPVDRSPERLYRDRHR